MGELASPKQPEKGTRRPRKCSSWPPILSVLFCLLTMCFDLARFVNPLWEQNTYDGRAYDPVDYGKDSAFLSLRTYDYHVAGAPVTTFNCPYDLPGAIPSDEPRSLLPRVMCMLQDGTPTDACRCPYKVRSRV